MSRRYIIEISELIKEWDLVNNNTDLGTVSIGSNTKYWWICSVCGHKWSAQIASRSAGSGCPKYREHPKRNKYV